MPAYWIAHVTVTDPERYKGYQALAPLAFAAHGAKFLARGGDHSVMEGPVLDRHVLLEFPSLDAARACYASPEYTVARQARDGACEAHVTLVDGLPS
jgi:uncharacterized protein (DUF1330 family)